MRRIHKIVVALGFALGVAASIAVWHTPGRPKDAFAATDITGLPSARNFDLTDHNGQRRRLADFRGKAVLVFLGYTSCPDACPTALADMAKVVNQFGADGKHVQVIFITIDPERDSAQRLSTYVTAFHPAFLGLRGSAEETARVTSDFKAYVRSDAPKEDIQMKHGVHAHKDYMVDHSTGIVAFDRHGRPRLFISAEGRSVAAISRDLRLLLEP